MAKDRRSRPRKSSEKRSESASRDPSPSSSSPPAPATSGDEEQQPQADLINDEGKVPQEPEKHDEDSESQENVVSESSEVPVLADSGPLNSPQIEPALGDIVEEHPHDGPEAYVQSPTNTDESSLGNPDSSSEASPTLRRPSYNLGAELGDMDADSSEDDKKTERNRSPTGKERLDPDPGQQPRSGIIGEAQGSNDATRGHTDDEFEGEVRKRVAAEERVLKLEAELRAQEQRHEEESAADKKKYERALEKANRAREADKLKFDEKHNAKEFEIKGFQEEIQKNVDNMAKLTVALENCERHVAEHSAEEDIRIKLQKTEEQLRYAIQKEASQSLIGHSLAAPGFPRPGSARFLLAECEYLLDKHSPLYEAVRAVANYADGRSDGPSGENKRLLDAFNDRLKDMNAFLEENLDRPQDCIREARRDWGFAAEENTW